MKPSASAVEPGLSRREAVKFVLLGCAGLAAGAGGAGFITRLTGPPEPFHFLSSSEGSLLTAICEQIIPADDTPGATDAGVVHFIDRQLQGSLSRYRGLYRSGLDAFDRICRRIHRRAFTDLSGQEQIAVLQLVEAGRAPAELWAVGSQTEFFRLVVTHTVQGFYGSPRHGGNRHYASYRVMGIPYPQVIGRNVHRATP